MQKKTKEAKRTLQLQEKKKQNPFLDLGLVEGPAGYRLHPNPKLGARRKVKWEKIENFFRSSFVFCFSCLEFLFFCFHMFLFDD